MPHMHLSCSENIVQLSNCKSPGGCERVNERFVVAIRNGPYILGELLAIIVSLGGVPCSVILF